MNRRRALAAFSGAAVLSLLAACPGASQSTSEDCDADDLIEGDEDCDDDSGKHKKKPKTKPKSGRSGRR